MENHLIVFLPAFFAISAVEYSIVDTPPASRGFLFAEFTANAYLIYHDFPSRIPG
jgi:hypothetical protein